MGAIIHHGVHGNADHPQKTCIPAQRDRLWFTRDGIPIRVLVVASSNSAIDNILSRLQRNVIPDGQVGRIDPQVVGIWRRNYEFPEKFRDYSLHDQCARYEASLEHRLYPSLREEKSFRAYCHHLPLNSIFIPTFSISWTLSIGWRFHSWRGWCIVWNWHVQSDDNYESYACIGKIVLNCIKYHCQLPSLSLVPYMIKVAEISLILDYESSAEYRFQCMTDNKRCKLYTLTSQFQMHPVISNAT